MSLIEVMVSILLLSSIFSVSLDIINKNNKIIKENRNSFNLETYISMGVKNLKREYKREGNYYDVLKRNFKIKEKEVLSYYKNKKYSYKEETFIDSSIGRTLIKNYIFKNGKVIDRITY